MATKVRVGPGGLDDPAGTVTRSLETSLRRLRRDRVDLLQLHDPVRVARADGQPGRGEVLERILPAFESLRRAGKIGFVGMTAIGDTPAIHRVLASGAVDSAQVPLQPPESDAPASPCRRAFPARTSTGSSTGPARSGWGWS